MKTGFTIIHMGDDSSCKIMEVGEVQSNMFDGSIRIILGGRQVSNLVKNLLLVRKFHEDGCELSRRKDQLMITKGEFVVAKWELKDGQHWFIRETRVNEASVISVMAKLVTIYHNCLSKSKLGLKVFLDRILS